MFPECSLTVQVPTKQQAAFKKSFALALDALPLDDDLKMRLIEEKRSIFPRNDQIIREVRMFRYCSDNVQIMFR
jgi:heme oxygenase